MWQFVPAEVRRSECLVLLRRHRVEYLEAVAARDAAVIARFERHPTTLKQRESSRKLSALTREMSSRKVTAAAAKEGYESVLAVLDSLAAPPGLEKSSSGGGGPPKGWERARVDRRAGGGAGFSAQAAREGARGARRARQADPRGEGAVQDGRDVGDAAGRLGT